MSTEEATKLTMRDLGEEEFQSIFESCSDMDPLGLVLGGEVIGLLNVRYDTELQVKLAALGIRDVTL